MSSNFQPLPMLPGMMPSNTPTPQSGVTPYRPNTGASIVQGINDFANNYLQTQDMFQQAAHRKFMDAIQAKMIGLPVDDEQVMKWAKQAKIPLRTDPYTPEEKQYQAQQEQQKQAWAALQQGGGVSPDQAQVLNQPPPTPPTAQAQAPQNIFQRLAAQFRQPQVSTDSPAGDWLKRLSSAVSVGGGLPGQIAQAGEKSNIEQSLFKQGASLASMNIDQQKQLIGMTRAMWAGDPQALDNLTRVNQAHPLPGDEMSDLVRMSMPGLPEEQVKQRAGEMMMWMQSGGPAMRLGMMKFAQDMMPRFMNSPNPLAAAWNYASDPMGAGEKPGWTPEEAEKRSNVFAKYHDASPDAPVDLIDKATDAQMTGNRTMLKAAEDALKQWPTSGQKQTYQFGQEWGGPGAGFGGMGVRGYEAQTGRIGSVPANVEAGAAVERVGVERGQLDLAKVRAVADAAGDQGKIAWDILKDPKSGVTEKNNALDMLASAMSKKASIKVKLGDQEFTMADPAKTVDNWRANLTSPTWWITGGQLSGAPRVLSGPSAMPMGQAPQAPAPITRGQHQPLPQEQIRQILQDLPQDQQSIIMKRSAPPGVDYSPLLQYLGQQPTK